MNTLPALAFNGVTVRDSGELLNLTDMWRAAGSPANREPFNWARKEGAPLLATIALTLNLPVEQVLISKPGRGGGTVAHWHASIAYAQYLSPEFQLWTNTVVRERMEARHVGALGSPLSADDLALLRRTDGIARQLSGKMVGVERALELILARLEGATPDPALNGTVEFKPALAVCEAAPAKKRRGLVHRVSARLLRYSVQNGHPLREEPFTGRRMFHVDAIAGWLAAEGRLLLSQHIADIQGAPVLPFKPRAA